MTDVTHLLGLYDEQLRTDAETPSATSVARLGPLRLVTFDGGRGFVTYPRLRDVPADAVGELVPAALGHFRADPAITRVEWKTRGHDHAPGLRETLLRHGFSAGDPESIMLGEISGLAADAPLPSGITLRQVTGCGAAASSTPGGGAASTVRSQPHAPGRPWPSGRRWCTATRRSTPARSSNGPAW